MAFKKLEKLMICTAFISGIAGLGLVVAGLLVTPLFPLLFPLGLAVIIVGTLGSFIAIDLADKFKGNSNNQNSSLVIQKESTSSSKIQKDLTSVIKSKSYGLNVPKLGSKQSNRNVKSNTNLTLLSDSKFKTSKRKPPENQAFAIKLHNKL